MAPSTSIRLRLSEATALSRRDRIRPDAARRESARKLITEAAPSGEGMLPIETCGAPNPTAKHADAGLLAKVTTAIGTDGTDLIPLPNSTHMDVMDCTVCHIYKKSMAVRSLDSTSGNRYPAMIGFDQSKGMFGMFTDPHDIRR